MPKKAKHFTREPKRTPHFDHIDRLHLDRMIYTANAGKPITSRLFSEGHRTGGRTVQLLFQRLVRQGYLRQEGTGKNATYTVLKDLNGRPFKVTPLERKVIGGVEVQMCPPGFAMGYTATSEVVMPRMKRDRLF